MKLSPHFFESEWACRGTGCCAGSCPMPDRRLLDALEELRAIAGPLTVNSGYRCNEHNRRVGGSKNSYHTKNMAVDIYSREHAPDMLMRMALEIPAFRFGGIGVYPLFIHVDIGPQRRWKGK